MTPPPRGPRGPQPGANTERGNPPHHQYSQPTRPDPGIPESSGGFDGFVAFSIALGILTALFVGVAFYVDSKQPPAPEKVTVCTTDGNVTVCREEWRDINQ
jgi:hypothetical protein